MLATFSRVESERSVSKFRRGKRQLPCGVHLLHKAGACEIRKFHVAGVQRRQRNLQNSMLHVQICFCFFVNKNLYFFATLLPSPSLVLLLSRNSATMVMWRNTSPLYWSFNFQFSGAPNVNFWKNICSEDDLRSRSFGTFCCKISCLPASPRIFEHLKNGITAHF